MALVTRQQIVAPQGLGGHVEAHSNNPKNVIQPIIGPSPWLHNPLVNANRLRLTDQVITRANAAWHGHLPSEKKMML